MLFCQRLAKACCCCIETYIIDEVECTVTLVANENSEFRCKQRTGYNDAVAIVMYVSDEKFLFYDLQDT